jgi:predicted transcriptional regulator YdeE
MKSRTPDSVLCCAVLAIGIALAVSSVAFPSQAKEGTPMPRVESQESFTVVGISARTNNAKEASPDGVIGKQWAKFFGEGVAAKIPNRADANIVAVYTDYASDVNGDYTFLIGARVTKTEILPEGLSAKTVPRGRYAVFTSERGQVQQVVVDTWKRIWATPKGDLGGDRAYKADFELYDQRAQNPADTLMEIHIGLK